MDPWISHRSFHHMATRHLMLTGQWQQWRTATNTTAWIWYAYTERCPRQGSSLCWPWWCACSWLSPLSPASAWSDTSACGRTGPRSWWWTAGNRPPSPAPLSQTPRRVCCLPVNTLIDITVNDLCHQHHHWLKTLLKHPQENNLITNWKVRKLNFILLQCLYNYYYLLLLEKEAHPEIVCMFCIVWSKF